MKIGIKKNSNYFMNEEDKLRTAIIFISVLKNLLALLS